MARGLGVLGRTKGSGAERGGDGPLSDYETELRHMDGAIAELEERAASGSLDREGETRRTAWLYRRAALTGDENAFRTAAAALDHALAGFPEWPDLWLLKAHLDARFHRFAAAARDLEQVPGLATSAAGRAVRADVDFEMGRDADAQRGYEDVVRDAPSWDNLARLAHLRAHVGDMDGAEQLYCRAEQEITAKELRAYAWVQLQRGLLARARGRNADAGAHYEQANRAYSGYWLVKEHVAELLGATGGLDRAVVLYREVLAVTPRPELHHSVGDLCARLGRPDQAAWHHDRAHAGYRASVARGEVHHLHQLARFCADVLDDRAAAVHWARQDVALRPNAFTRATLAQLEGDEEAGAGFSYPQSFFAVSPGASPAR